MASRQETFARMLPAIHAQVDHVYIYLDGYASPPPFLKGLDRITVTHAEAVGDLHCSSRFLCLRELSGPAVVITVDDDIAYPPDYAAALAGELQRFDGKVLVGVHGRIFRPPHQSYVDDVDCLHFADRLKRSRFVHELGTGTIAFVSDRLPLDPLTWERHDMDDILVATEAQKRGMARLAVARAQGWLTPYDQCQEDSLWTRTRKDPGEQGRLMRALLALHV